MVTLPDERLEHAILREAYTAGYAFVRRMLDVQASAYEGTLALAAMLVHISAQCHCQYSP